MRISVYRKAHFYAAHRLHVKHWSDEKNKAFFGLCNNPLYHGHNYDLEVKVTGEMDPVTGILIDLGLLAKIIKEEVENKLDHKNLNLEIEEFKDKNPSAENICIYIWRILSEKLPKDLEIQVRLYETARNYVEFPA